LKQTKLRRRRVVRYAILYFFLLVVFIALLVGPVVAGKFLKLTIDIPMDLLQPTGLNNNDTTSSVTGSCLGGMQCPGPGGEDAAEATDSSSSEKFRRFMAF
jgi:1,3-beta-glucan synthase